MQIFHIMNTKYIKSFTCISGIFFSKLFFILYLRYKKSVVFHTFYIPISFIQKKTRLCSLLVMQNNVSCKTSNIEFYTLIK